MEEDRAKEDYNNYYEKLERIGKGSYGKVHKVKDKKTNELSCVFSMDELADYSSFSSALLEKIELNQTNKFSQMLMWLIGSENRKLDKYPRAEDFVPAMGINGIDQNNVHGFLFWC